MAVTLQELVVKIQGDTADLKAAMLESQNLVKSGTEQMVSAIQKMSEKSAADMGFFKQAAETAFGVFTAEAVIHSLESLGESIKAYLIDTMRESIKASSDLEVAQNRMNIALANSGNYSEQSSRGMLEFSEKMMETTGSTVEATLSAAAYIGMLTKLDEEGLKRATHAAIELAATLNIDLQSATHLVAKAVEGNVMMLHRYGIEVEVGANKSENLANLITALGNNMGNAERMMGTWSGAMKLNSAMHEELHVAIGKIITENQVVISVINTVTDWYKENTKTINANLSSYKELVGLGIIVAIHAMEGLVIVAQMVVTALETIFAPIKILIAEIEALHEVMKTGDHDWPAIWGRLKDSVVGAYKDIGNSMSKDSKLGELGALFAKAELAAEKGYVAMAMGAKSAAQSNGQATDEVKRLTDAEQKLYDEGLKVYQQELKRDPNLKYAIELKALQMYHKHANGEDTEYSQALAQLETDRTKKFQEENYKKIQILMQSNADMKKLDAQKYEDEINANQAKIERLEADENISKDKKLEIARKEKEEKKKLHDMEEHEFYKFSDNLVTIGKAMGAEGFEVAKRAAQAKAIVSAFVSANESFEAMAGIPIVGPALGAVAAAAAIAAGMVNVSQIESTHLATGIDTVPGVGFGDSFPATLEPGEGVIDKGTNASLKNFFSSDGSNPLSKAMSQMASKIDQLSQAIMQTPIQVQVGGKIITDTVRQEIRLGRKIFV